MMVTVYCNDESIMMDTDGRCMCAKEQNRTLLLTPAAVGHLDTALADSDGNHFTRHAGKG